MNIIFQNLFHSKAKLKEFVVLGSVSILLFSPLAHPSPEDGSPLAWGSAANRETCPDEASYAWIEHAQGFDCIRYFVGAEISQAAVVIVMLSGDRDRLLRRPPEEIRNNTRRTREAIATKLSEQSGVPVVLVSRPGIYGSSGDHRQRRQAREFLALDGALSSLRLRYEVGQFALLGHSGGATAAAAILTLGRDDILCAVLTSGAYDLAERTRRRALEAGRHWTENLDTTGLDQPFDPLHYVEHIVPDPRRRIYVLGNPQDKITPFDLQKKFAAAVAAAGHYVELRIAPARAPTFHDLLDDTGLKTVSECIATDKKDAASKAR